MSVVESNSSSNINSDELDEETKSRLKGDTIGDTLYSESFVIKTLLQLSDVKWGPEVEQDLCFLWDMTLEKDVCKYLFNLNYPSLACTAISRYEEGRLIEIIVGILSNMLMADCEKNITKNEMEIILHEIHTTNSAVLIQLMRFIEAIAYMDESSIIEGEIIQKILFVLSYSKNTLLLTHSMQALIRLTDNFKLDRCEVNVEMYEAVITAFDTIFSVETNNFEIEIDTEETSKQVKVFFNLISNICAYVHKYDTYPQDKELPNCISNCPKLKVSIIKILKHFSHEKYLFPVTKDFSLHIWYFMQILTTRDVILSNDFFTSLFNVLCSILYLLSKYKSEVSDAFGIVVEFVGYLVYTVEKGLVLNELMELPYKKGIVILNCLKEEAKGFGFDLSEKLHCFFTEYK